MDDLHKDGHTALALELLRHAVRDDLVSYDEAHPLLQTLLPRSADPAHAPYALLRLLLDSGEPAALALAQRIHTTILHEAVLAAQACRTNPGHAWRTSPALSHLPPEIPLAWQNDDLTLAALQQAVVLERDRAFLLATAPDLTGALRAVTEACSGQQDLIRAEPAGWRLLPPAMLWSGFALPPGTALPPGAASDPQAEEDAQLAELVRLATAESGPAAFDALQRLVTWPDAAVAPFLLQACAAAPVCKTFAMHALALRTGLEYTTWWEWEKWLKRAGAAVVERRTAVVRMVDDFRDELRLLWVRAQAGSADAALETALAAAVTEAARRNHDAAGFLRRWERVLAPAEIARFEGSMPDAPARPPERARIVPSAEVSSRPPMAARHIPPTAPPPLPVLAANDQPPPLPMAAPTPGLRRSNPEPPPPSGPTVWGAHIQPFLAANWYIIAGLLMVVAGASLLAYFTWDKSALVRYLFLPVLLGVFTGGMAELGLRLFRRHADLRATGTFLLGGSVCLLPVNFMVLCRAGDDPRAAGLVLPAFGLYAALTGCGLWRWCGAVRGELRLLLAAPLLAMNLLAVLGDMPGLREAAAGHRATLIPVTITAAVLLLLAVSNRFLRVVLTRELLTATLIPWFFGITLAATTIQVAAWRHFHLHIAPRPQDYALAAILAGATLLRWERRACELRDTGAAYGGESFLGYAALLLGILMAAGNEWLRIAALLLAGAIWLAQAPRRPGVVHYWIGATLCLLGGAAVGMLDVFPKTRECNLLPELGLALALLAGAGRALAGRRGETRLRQVMIEIQPPLLLFTVIVAVLSQYNLRSEPWQTGVVLVAGALFFAVRATRENRRDWLHIAAACAGLSLPYLGCADMMRYRFEGNTLALGFGLLASLWLLASRLLPGGLWRTRGSFLVICFGAAGVFGLCLRLLLGNRPMLAGAELAGGALLAVALGIAAWQSRSQVAGLLVAALLAVILPFFRVPADVVPAWFQVGTGLTSAAVALALTLACFGLRRAEARRGISGLFLVPVLAAAVWLSGKALALQLQRHHNQTPFVASILLVSATAYAAAILFRLRPAGRVFYHVSWLLGAAGVTMACDAAGCRGLAMLQYPLLWTGVALTALLAAEAAVARRLEWAGAYLVQPRLTLLARASAGVAALLAVAILLPLADDRARLHWLAIFLAAQLVWQGLRTSRRRFGAVLFLLTACWLCTGWDPPASYGDLPALCLLVLLADAGLEVLPIPRAWLHALHAPFLAGATALAPVLAALAMFSIHPTAGGVQDLDLPRTEAAMVVAALLLVARAQACAGFALPAAVLGYLLCLLPCGADELFRPWRLADFALLLCLLPFPARRLSMRWPRLLRGVAPQLSQLSAAPQAPWFFLPGLMLAVYGAFFQVVLTVTGQADDARGMQILAPFAAGAAFALAGWYWRRGALWAVAACLLPLANAFAICVLWGRDLLDLQLSPAHIIGAAAVLSMAEFATARWLVLRPGHLPRLPAAHWLHVGCTVLAALTLVLLGMHYMTNPDLAQIPVIRFSVSGMLALAAGVYFRFAARRPENLHTTAGLWMESLWHVSLGLTLWCGALMVPALRTPHAALYALGLPAAFCWLASEWFLRVCPCTEKNTLTGERFRTSTASFAVLILVLYVFRLPFQMLLFPQAVLELDVYHTGAAAALLMGLILIRVRGLGGAPWTAFSGGLALMTGVYFLVTWLPGLSPFAFPMAAAWTAVVTAQLFVLLSYQQSPLRSLIQHMGGIGEEEWHAYRRAWGLFLTAAAHVAVVAGLLQEYQAHHWETTPLLAALASVLIHQAVIGAPWARAYWGIAVFEILLALHLDFILPQGAPGLIPARDVIWFLLAAWLAVAVFWRQLRNPLAPVVSWLGAGRLALLCAGHLLYHGAATGSGLLVAAFLVLNALLTPLNTLAPAARVFAALTLAAPPWLAYFGSRWLTGDAPDGFRPLLAGIAALLGSGLLVRAAERTAALSRPFTCIHRLAHELLAFCRRGGAAAARTLLACAFAGLILLTFLHDDARHGSLGMMLALALAWGVSCAAWLREGYLRDGTAPYTLCVLSLAGAWILLRRLLFRHFSFWTYEYDIWLSLGAAIAFSSAKRLVQHQQPGMARTLSGVVWLLPAVQCVWLLSNRMSADLSLLVIGIQAALFAWHGGGKRDSPYNAISMLGFVGFVCLLLWAKLDLRCVQAYTIPGGLGVLGLVWLFGEHMPPALRNAVRLVTVLVMLGSCGYYALLDNRYPIGFHLTMLVLCLAVMALGPALRVQIYLYLGFAGFATDLVALVVKQFHALDRSIQMMGIGALLLLLGIAVVGGAILCKTRREAIFTLAARIRTRLGAWE